MIKLLAKACEWLAIAATVSAITYAAELAFIALDRHRRN